VDKGRQRGDGDDNLRTGTTLLGIRESKQADATDSTMISAVEICPLTVCRSSGWRCQFEISANATTAAAGSARHD